MKCLLAWLSLALAALPLSAQGGEIKLRDIPALVASEDLSIDLSRQATRMAYSQYLSTRSRSFPQLELSSGYKLQFTPQQESTVYTFLANPPPGSLPISVDDQSNSLSCAPPWPERSESWRLPLAGKACAEWLSGKRSRRWSSK